MECRSLFLPPRPPSPPAIVGPTTLLCRICHLEIIGEVETNQSGDRRPPRRIASLSTSLSNISPPPSPLGSRLLIVTTNHPLSNFHCADPLLVWIFKMIYYGMTHL